MNIMAARKNLQIEFNIPDDLEIFVDPQAVRQILINLLSNAVKLNRTGGRVVIKAFRDRSVTISISDTGPGMDSQMLAHVFEPFAQATPEHARQTEGTGLGLSIVKHLAELHGGGVSIDSQPGNGTIVMVRLPDRSVGCISSALR